MNTGLLILLIGLTMAGIGLLISASIDPRAGGPILIFLGVLMTLFGILVMFVVWIVHREVRRATTIGCARCGASV